MSVRDLAADLRQWHGDSGPRATPLLAAGPLPARITARVAVLLALIAAVPILAFVLLGRGTEPPIAEKSVRRLTSHGHASMATISPDGRYVAYITTGADGFTLLLEQIATGRTITIVPVTRAHYMGLTFSRDGEYLYFARYDGGPLGTLYRVAILGGAAEALVKDIDSRAAVSPDGKQLAFVRDDFNKGTSTVVIVNADGSDERALAQFRVPDRVFAPAWSPDGSRIVAAHVDRLVSIDVNTGMFRRIETDVPFEAVRGAAWRDDSHVVTAATTEEAAGHYRLWSIDVGSGNATALTGDLTELYAPTISDSGAIAALQVIRQSNVFEVVPNGGITQLTTGVGASTGFSGVAWLGDNVIYGSVSDGQMDLYSRRGSEVTQLTNDTAFELEPAVAPNGTFIVYLAADALWRVAPDGTDRRRLTDGPRDAAFAISPDSKSIAYASFDAKANEWVLYVMPSEGGERRRIASRHSILDDVRFADGGKALLFTGYHKDMLRLYRVPVNGGTPVMLVDGRAHQPAVSRDGSMIAAPSGSPERTHAAVTLVPARGGPAKSLELDAAMYRWYPRGNALSYVREENGAMNLWLRPLHGGEAKKLTSFSEGTIAAYAWRDDGSRAAVTHVVDSTDVVLIR